MYLYKHGTVLRDISDIVDTPDPNSCGKIGKIQKYNNMSCTAIAPNIIARGDRPCTNIFYNPLCHLFNS